MKLVPYNHHMEELFHPTHLKELCQEYGLSPSKRYGQNYLVTKSVVEKIIAAADLKKDDVVIEIGPGFGVLTFALAPRVKNVIAFEIEKKLQPYWEEKQKEYDNIDIVWGNALREFQVESEKLKETYKVVANLPYQITSRAIRTILEADQKPERIVFMVQKEVAQRIVAAPGDMSLLAVSVQYYGTPRIITKVSKGNFWPTPKVDSAVLSIVPHQDTSSTKEAATFFRIVRAGFQNKRKQLWRNLSTGLSVSADHAKDVLKKVVGNEKVRAEELSLGHWRGIVEKLEKEK